MLMSGEKILIFVFLLKERETRVAQGSIESGRGGDRSCSGTRREILYSVTAKSAHLFAYVNNVS